MAPFISSASRPGHGEIHVALLPPATPSFERLSFAYPLKLIPSSPHKLEGSETLCVPLVFMLSYGGGLLPPDEISLDVTLDPATRLTLTTQGSTKVFPAQPDSAPASQSLRAKLGQGSALVLSPEPVQPFKNSLYAQVQTFEVSGGASLFVLDWVNAGREARGEFWDAAGWTGRNEIWHGSRLLIRDTLKLTDGPSGLGQSSMKDEKLGIVGTLLLCGPLFEGTGGFFVDEFRSLPRIGARDWGDQTENRESWQKSRQRLEAADGVVWTAAKMRGVYVIKFAARELEGAQRWLRSMLGRDGTVEREFGPGGLMSFRQSQQN